MFWRWSFVQFHICFTSESYNKRRPSVQLITIMPLLCFCVFLPTKTETVVDRHGIEEMFVAIAPLLEISVPSKPMFDFFTKVSMSAQRFV